MFGCQQWSGEPEAERGSRCRKSEVLGDFEALLAHRDQFVVIKIFKMMLCTCVQYGTRHIVDTMRAAGQKVEMVVVCGGLAKNKLYIQTHADILGSESICGL